MCYFLNCIILNAAVELLSPSSRQPVLGCCYIIVSLILYSTVLRSQEQEAHSGACSSGNRRGRKYGVTPTYDNPNIAKCQVSQSPHVKRDSNQSGRIASSPVTVAHLIS